MADPIPPQEDHLLQQVQQAQDLLNPPPAAPLPAEHPPIQAPAQLEVYITSFKLYFLSLFSAVFLLLLYLIACSYPFVRLILLYFSFICIVSALSHLLY